MMTVTALTPDEPDEGFEAPETIYKLTFVDENMSGLQIRSTSPSFGDFFEISKLAELENQELSARDLPKVLPLFEIFMEHVISWNLRKKGKPVPETVAGLLTQEFPFIMRMIDGWMREIMSVPDPLGQPSLDGEQFPVGLIPMEPLSENPAS